MYSNPYERSGPRGRRRHPLRGMSGRGHGRHGDWRWGGFGPGGSGGPGGWGGRRRRMRRGDVRAALLVLLDEGPQTGYGLMEEIERRSDGAWRPSPGSVYPALALLEDEGLVQPVEEEGRKPFALTDAGKTHVAENREALGEPWTKPAEGVGEERLELRGLIAQIGGAVYQVAAAGDDDQIKRASELLNETRRGLYRILADDEPGDTTDA